MGVDVKAREDIVLALGDALRGRGWKLACAESCTGGLIAAECTSVAGSSDWFERGFVTYSNEAKVEAIGVAAALIAAHGAVSAEVAHAMAKGALMHSRADVAVAVTGIAGPGGATEGKPVGTVWLAIARRRAGAGIEADGGADADADAGAGAGAGADAGAGAGIEIATELLSLNGDRAQVREQTVRQALQRLLACARRA